MLSLLLAASVASLSPLIERCPEIALMHGGCGDLMKPVWRRFPGREGAVAKVNTRSIVRIGRFEATATVYVFYPGMTLDLSLLKSMWFDCHGYYSIMPNIEHRDFAPPHTIVRDVSDAVCKAAGSVKRPSPPIIVNDAG